MGGLPALPTGHTPRWKAGWGRQSASGDRKRDGAHAQGISPAWRGRWKREALKGAVPSSAERGEIKQRRAELRRVEMERDSLKKVVTIFSQPPQS